MMRMSFSIVGGLGLLLAVSAPAPAQRQMENLTRGIVAVETADDEVYIGWRLFATDPESIAFNLFRLAAGGAPVRVNTVPLSGATNYIDRGVHTGQVLQYFVRPVVNGDELAASKPTDVWEHGYLEIPLQPIAEYRPGDASIADLDSDGQYELVLHQMSRARDNSHPGITGTPILDAETQHSPCRERRRNCRHQGRLNHAVHGRSSSIFGATIL